MSKIPKPLSRIEELFALHCRAYKLEPVRELEFAKHLGRKYRFDFAWPEAKLAVECEGGTWTNGGHSRGKGMEENARKYNTAVLLGYRVLRFTCDMIDSGEAIQVTMEALKCTSPS